MKKLFIMSLFSLCSFAHAADPDLNKAQTTTNTITTPKGYTPCANNELDKCSLILYPNGMKIMMGPRWFALESLQRLKSERSDVAFFKSIQS